MKGIDVSHWNGKPFNQVTEKAYRDADFVIVKATQGVNFIDPCWKANADRVLRDGKLLGLYHYATGAEAKAEAEFFLNVVEKYVGKAVLAIDWESGQNKAWGSKTWVKAFCNTVFGKVKIRPLIYVQASATAQVSSLANQYPLWIAGYPVKDFTSWIPPKFPYLSRLAGWPNYSIWQYTSAGGVDRNVSTISKNDWLELQGGDKRSVPRETLTSSQKTVSALAVEVLAGKWGSGNERKQRLLQAGYPYSEIQAEVNRLLALKNKNALKAGSQVKVKPNSFIYGTHRIFASHVYRTTYVLHEIKNDRAVIRKGDVIVGAVHKDDLIPQ